jgi:hypothetical protein
MKLTLPTLLIVIGFAFSACQKELSYEVDPGTTGGSGGGGNGGGGSSSYYIKGKKDGNAFSFTNNTMAMISNLGGAASVSLVAGASANASSFEGLNLGINFTGTATLATTTYAENDGSTEHIVAGVYNPNSTTIVYGAGLSPNSVKPLKIIITALSSTEVSGSFEGAFYKTDVANGTISTTDYVSFTEATFKLPVK